jgi:hypothetical protein
MSTERDLIEQLKGCPETEILAVLSASGVGGARGRDEPWMVRITFAGWRPAGGSFRKTEMVVRKEVSDSELRALQSAMKPYDVVRIRGRFAEESCVSGSPQALLGTFVGIDRSDPELNAYALELQEPVTFVDPQFGLFTLDRRVNWYEATPVWCGNSVRLTITAGIRDEMERSLAVARQLWAQEAEWQRRITAYATQELLGLKNESWLNEDGPEVTEEEFARRMVVDAISVQADGSFEFWHDDDDLFLGHAIMVSGDLKDGPKNAGIHG